MYVYIYIYAKLALSFPGGGMQGNSSAGDDCTWNADESTWSADNSAWKARARRGLRQARQQPGSGKA